VVLDLEGLDRIRRSQQSITAGDDVAFSHNLNRMRATNRDGEQTELWFRQTMYFCKIDGDWKIRARARLLIVSVHQRPRLKLGRAEGVEQLGRVFASVAGEVTVVAVDHGQACAHVAGEVEGRDAAAKIIIGP
jgi:hypothetical protein